MTNWKKLYVEIRESQLNELSRNTLKSYVGKAQNSISDIRDKQRVVSYQKGKEAKEKWNKLERKAGSRHDNIQKASRKLNKFRHYNEETLPIYEGHDDVRIEMGHAVTRYDRKQEEKSIKNPKHYHNHYALGHYLGAADRAHEDLKKGHSLADAINNNFNGALARHLHKHFKTGDTDVDTKRKKYFNS
jgi:hypothetical protein